MKISDIEARTRAIMNDAYEPQRWSHESIRRGLQDGIRRLHALTPSTRYIDGLLVDCVILPTVDEEEDDDSFPIDDRYLEALTYYTVYHCYTYDDPDTQNGQLAQENLAKAERLMQQ